MLVSKETAVLLRYTHSLPQPKQKIFVAIDTSSRRTVGPGMVPGSLLQKVSLKRSWLNCATSISGVSGFGQVPIQVSFPWQVKLSKPILHLPMVSATHVLSSSLSQSSSTSS